VPDLLLGLKCTLAISTYQAGKIIFLSPKDTDSLIQLPRTFAKPMGITEDVEGDRLAIACKDEILVLANSTELAEYYPPSPNKYDALYMPRTTHHTSGLDVHDVRFGQGGKIYAVNTLFSCIMQVDDKFNFVPYWMPPQIDALVSEDRCHLNGMVMVNGLPRYATAFNEGNAHASWRETLTTSGVVWDIEKNEVIASGLGMPHSPRIFGEHLYVLESAKGCLTRIDLASGAQEKVVEYEGFLRGMSLHKDYLFIGLSKLRKNSSTFGKLPFAEKANEAGILIYHLPTASFAGKITYNTSVDEIYDVHVLADKMRPNILNTLKEDYKLGLMTPNATYWGKKAENDIKPQQKI